MLHKPLKIISEYRVKVHIVESGENVHDTHVYFVIKISEDGAPFLVHFPISFFNKKKEESLIDRIRLSWK